MIAASQAGTLASAIAFTIVAGGDKELAVILTVLSNALACVLTPLVLVLTVGTVVRLPLGAMMEQMALVVLAPVALGQVLRLCFWSRATPYLWCLRLVPQGIILTFVYAGCSTASGELNREPVLAFQFLATCASLHLVLLGSTYGAATLIRLPASARTAVVFCGSQKTLPSGIYLWRQFFPSNPSGAVALVLYHIFQLLADTLILPLVAGHPEALPRRAPPPVRAST
jgi:sodium/bile acid cotransporter 7